MHVRAVDAPVSLFVYWKSQVHVQNECACRNAAITNVLCRATQGNFDVWMPRRMNAMMRNNGGFDMWYGVCAYLYLL